MSKETGEDAAVPQRSRLLIPLAAIIVALLTLAVFGRCVGFDFVNWDDPANVYTNPHFLPVTAGSVAYLWRHAYFELYMPLTYSLWAACALLGGTGGLLHAFPAGSSGAPFSPAPFHALNVLLHASSAVCVFWLLWRLSRRFGDRDEATDSGLRVFAAAAGALLFALHPLQVECVAWVTGGNNVVSGFFCLLALLCYLSFVESAESEGRRDRAIGWFVAATACYVLALLGKPTAASLPLVVGVLEIGIFRRPWRRWLPGLLLWIALAGAEALITRASSEASRAAYLPLWGRPFIIGDALAFYLGKLFFPFHMGVDYGHHPIRVVLGSRWGYVTWLVPVAVGVLLARLRLRWVGIGALLFVASTLPILGIVPFYVHRFSSVADRYLYLAMIGPALALTWAIWFGSSRLRSAQGATVGLRAGVAILLCLLALRTWNQASVWRDGAALFTHAIAINPRSGPAYNNLGLEYGHRGDLPSALRSFQESIRYDPDDSRARYNLAMTLAEMGRTEEAIPELQKTVQLAPKFDEGWFKLGVLLARQPGQTEEAITALTQAATLAPKQVEPRYILGVLLGSQKRYAEAEKWCAEAVRLQPENAEAHYNLAVVRARQGHLAEALPEYEAAVRLAPNEARFAKGLQGAQRQLSAPRR